MGLSVLVVLAVVAGGAFVVLRGGRQYPSAWDARVDPIARWVAKERKLSFAHPVEVQFLSEAAYRKVSTGGEAVEADPAADAAMDDTVAQLRALGLVEGEVDLNSASDTLSDSGTLAFYDPSSEKIFVRGTELTPGLRVTLAHEITHVLQDQAFDLERLQDLPDGKGATLRAIAEGDASRIEDRYAADGLTPEERAAYEKESQVSGAEATKDIEGKVPPILTALFAAPYKFGPELVAYLDRSGGDAAIDAALRQPPGEAVLFNPLVKGTDAAEIDKLEVEAPSGRKAIDSGEVGPTSWYLLLASRMEPSTALRATDGLAGDGYVVFRQDKNVCVRAYATGNTDKDLQELSGALTAWVKKSPAGSASVEVRNDEVRFQSCDPGVDAKGAGSVSVDLLNLPVLRTQLYVQVLASGGTDAQGTCLAEGVIGRFTFAQLSEETYLGRPESQRALAELQASCR